MFVIHDNDYVIVASVPQQAASRTSHYSGLYVTQQLPKLQTQCTIVIECNILYHHVVQQLLSSKYTLFTVMISVDL